MDYYERIAEQPWTGERRLALAVLEDALRIIGNPQRELQVMRKGRGSQRALRGRDREIAWIDSDDTENVFSFVNCCTIIGIDPEWVRRELRKRSDGPLRFHRFFSGRRFGRHPVNIAGRRRTAAA